MARMVDKDKLLTILAERHLSTGKLIQLQYAIEEAEVEVPDVIKCKDCKYWHEVYCEMLPDEETDVDFFCGYGERREDSGEDKKHG